MRKILNYETKKEMPNQQALGAFNSAVAKTNKVIESGNTGGETRAQILAYFRVSAKERGRRSREAFDNYNEGKLYR